MAKMGARKGAGKAIAKAKPAPKKNPGSGLASHKKFGIHGLAEILTAVKTAGLKDEFNKEVGKNGTFVHVHRNGLARIKKFIDSKPQLAELSQRTDDCDCPKGDPDCIYFGPHG